MKKVIDNRTYNTETSTFCGDWDHNITDDLYGFTESLYQKRSGEFFIVGDGGPGTIYSRPTPNGGRIGAQKIVPLSIGKAREWAEEHLTVEEYLKLFEPEPDPAEKKKALNLYVSEYLVDKAKLAAQEKGLSLSAYIEELIKRG